MNVAVIQFPGSNCDQDCVQAIRQVLNASVRSPQVRLVWHKESSLANVDCVVLPGGFSYGDYLRPGAIARQSPIMQEVVRLAKRGTPVLAICNGFQVATEAGLLPGALMRNRDLQFVCDQVYLRVENVTTRFTMSLRANAKQSRVTAGSPRPVGPRDDKEIPIIRMPIAHADGNYFADTETLQRLEGNGQILFRYCDAHGEATDAANPNGSLRNIAGIINEAGNVLGLMPHPERACDDQIGGHDGRGVFESILI